MTDRRHIWQTWSRTVRCRPARWITPRVEGQLTEAVRTAAEQGLGVRVAGSGHSFNQLACTEDMLLDLSGYTGVLDIDRRAATVTVRGAPGSPRSTPRSTARAWRWPTSAHSTPRRSPARSPPATTARASRTGRSPPRCRRCDWSPPRGPCCAWMRSPS
ncbi:FAD-binding protein [Actinomadura sp. J1-007]|nr:FAD-binding protein [Actinomadura sp. J1-007]MWK35650.1 FAD-binding protein [Actinomadura sp. J1-007]